MQRQAPIIINVGGAGPRKATENRPHTQPPSTTAKPQTKEEKEQWERDLEDYRKKGMSSRSRVEGARAEREFRVPMPLMPEEQPGWLERIRHAVTGRSYREMRSREKAAQPNIRGTRDLAIRLGLRTDLQVRSNLCAYASRSEESRSRYGLDSTSTPSTRTQTTARPLRSKSIRQSGPEYYEQGVWRDYTSDSR